MAENEDQSLEKTEEPTQRRIQEAVKKGQVAFSREVTNFLMLVVLALNIVWLAPYFMKQVTLTMAYFIQSPHDLLTDQGGLIQLAAETLKTAAILIMIPIFLTMLAAVLSSFMQNGFIFSSESIMPKLEKISPLKGLKRLFSLRSVIEFIKGIIKITLVGIVAFLAVWPQMHKLEGMVSYDVQSILALLSTFALEMVIGACAIMLIIAVLDYLYQRFEYIKGLRMTRQELKEEFKQTEGDPKIKSKLRQIRMERMQKRMMAAVPTADVVITNPTHFAVALKYDDARMGAPMVVAKGQDFIALKIRELAEASKVPIVENPPLARALHESAEINQEIPLEHYQAVAEVISYVYKLKGKMPTRAAG